MTAHPDGVMHDMADELRTLRQGEMPDRTVDVIAKQAAHDLIERYPDEGAQALLALTMLDGMLREVEEGTVFDKDAFFGAQARGVVEAFRERGAL